MNRHERRAARKGHGDHTAFISITPPPNDGRPYRGRCKACPSVASFEKVEDAAAWCDAHDGKAEDRARWDALQARRAKANNN